MFKYLRKMHALLLLLTLNYTGIVQSDNTIDNSIHLTANSFEELFNAIETSNQTDRKVVVITNGTILLISTLPPIKGKLTIRGPRFKSVNPAEGGHVILPVIQVESGGVLQLDNLSFEDLDISTRFDVSYPLIMNSGNLQITNALFRNIKGRCHTFGGFGPHLQSTNCNSTIINKGEITLINTVFENISMSFVEADTIPDSSVLNNIGGNARLIQVVVNNTEALSHEDDNFFRREALVPAIRHNGGTMNIRSSTLTGTRAGISVDADSSLNIANSIIEFDQDNCIFDSQARIQSRGGNISNDASCGFNATGDLDGVATGLLTKKTRLISSTFSLAVTVPVLTPSSPAIDSAVQSLCLEKDIFDEKRTIDGNNDGNGGCDRGAVETADVELISGGLNGMYYSPEADGHYLTILENTNDTVVVTWTTFDKQGNQAWVYGVGELINGRSITTEVSINLNGSMLANGQLSPSDATPWGSIQVDLNSCDAGMVEYQANDQNKFSSGRFGIQRLVAVKQLGCRDK